MLFRSPNRNRLGRLMRVSCCRNDSFRGLRNAGGSAGIKLSKYLDRSPGLRKARAPSLPIFRNVQAGAGSKAVARNRKARIPPP